MIGKGEALLMEARVVESQRRDEHLALEHEVATTSAALGMEKDWAKLLGAAAKAADTARWWLRDHTEKLQAIKRDLGVLGEKLSQATQAEAEATIVEEEMRTDRARLDRLKVLVTAFGKQGIPALLIERAVPDLEAIANDVLGVLSDGRMSLELRSTRDTAAKTTVETLDIVVLTSAGERPYENFSGGEAMRVDLALRMALSQLRASRAGARCEMLVLDETCAPLDDDGRAMFVDCLSRAAERFATVLVITHVPELKELFPVCLQITKDHAGSHVEVVSK